MNMPGQQPLVQLWERLQVELHGQYSVARFEALVQYQARYTTRLRALAVAILGPLPFALLIVSVDAMPLVPVSEGLYKQNAAFWLRTFLIGWLTSYTLIYQTCIAVPLLPMSSIRLWSITTICAAGTCTMGLAFILLIGFPVPFAIEFESGPFLLMLGTALWISWKDTLRSNLLARQNLKRYLYVLAVQIIMLQAYIGFNLAFNQLHGLRHALFSCLLPLIKLFFKNCIGKSTFHLEDLSPTVVVFSVDVFHALFVSFTMQQASANGANIIVIFVDVVQNCAAYYELSRVLDRVPVLTDEGAQRKSSTIPRKEYEASIQVRSSVIDYVAYVLHTVDVVRHHPRIALPRQSRGSEASIIVFASRHESRRQETSKSRVSPTIDDSRVQSQPKALRITDLQTQVPTFRQVECTKCVLKVLHMIEFYVLVEYVEATLSVSYALYMLVLSYRPSHRFYTQLNHLSSAQLRLTAWRVGVYAAAEVLSLVLFCVAVDRKVKHFSTLKQLAFALETNGKLIYAITVGWVFMIVQISLEHFGSDYSFQFKWLKQSPASSTPKS